MWRPDRSARGPDRPTYRDIDPLNRVFAGDDPASFPNQGTGWQFVDKDHNLPSGKDAEPPIDYKAAYEKIWSGS